MPEAQAAAAAPPAEGKSLVTSIAQSIGLFLLVQGGMKYFMPATPKSAPAVSDPSQAGSAVVAKPSNVVIPAWEQRPQALDPGVQWSPIPYAAAPMWPAGTEMDIAMYISSSIAMPPLKSMPQDTLLIDEKNFKFGDYNENREINTEFKVPKAVQQNATLLAHFYVAQSGSVIDPTQPGYDTAKAYHFIRPLSQYQPKKKIAKTRNLLSDMPERVEAETEEEKNAPKIVASYYHPNFTVSLIPDAGTVQYANMHPGPRKFITLEATGARDASGQHSWYYPIVFTNTFWQLKKHMIELNDTVTTLPLNVKLNNFAHWKFNIIAAMDENLNANARAAAAGQSTPGGGDGSEMEMFKEILIDSNSYLLAITAVVSVFHMIFEMLAFKNDVQHWRKKKDNVGTSVRTILANVFMQAVIFLYLIDNNENTSYMILFGQGMGMAIEAWKITKSVNVRIRPTAPGSLIPYTIVFEDKHVLSETEKKTEEYDAIAFKYLYMVAVPLLVAYAIYSLMYDTHKSWYSFIITTLVGSVYAYGFLMMVPALYINYRLQSVAHMPGRAMTYKFLNTFIDDLFAFTIKMPTLHRLATLRDDVIFFVYLFQTWKYKVDYNRINEFGQGGDDEEVEEKDANKPLVASAGADKGLKVPDQEKVEKLKEEKEGVKASGSQKKGGATKRK
ncbi:cleft lip and palate associated transmembrane protein 1 [Pyrenophora tritici-repentis]|uniref:Cleft lip and palate associated transmembrane protein n=2 Tax=Pyrenophora tritici-repentis TaxID=45151 RepID=A0A2W1H2I8_9PLEO|nr:cleft lip and palate associated transmembrane protein 1 [Pyrenophora tritici-repentis Pt-1C-BFP]KAA8620320.1 Cleft lip and palate associated transmembrane protein 1 [Pyrenophora tritici-repentis]EDU46463.1 cleft lip and palate associated transmembrane protein 1 [Pyrenophora tritici-repentis Pt-1C-BFP]KAF7448472.1 Cleft lip and palate associated transmembrane protein [Pyrenophora tritici-repentis]KAF7572194.1 cleft lip and palate associated transmembrane protein 1 [Pyrenophora tritici-repenti